MNETRGPKLVLDATMIPYAVAGVAELVWGRSPTDRDVATASRSA
jgi:hypothetical protein